MTLHTYGDSHASFHGGWMNMDITELSINCNWLGPKLMYSTGRDKKQFVKLNEINKGDIICFCFGEIDCRCHINKYDDWESVIDGIIEEYFKVIKLNINNLCDVKISVYNVVPPLERENNVNKWIRDWEIQSKTEFIVLGSDVEIKKYTLYMNEKISEYCLKYNYIYFDIYKKYLNERGFLKRELSDTNCHIKNPIYIEEFIKNNLL